MIRAVTFDLEGTVIDVERAHHEGHLRAAADVGVALTFESAIQLLPSFIGGAKGSCAREIWELSDKKQSLEFVLERDVFHYHELLKDMEIMVRLGFVDVLSYLDRHLIKLALGSGTMREEAFVLIHCLPLLMRHRLPIEHMVFGDDVLNQKPAPDVFLETARRMGVAPEEQLVFEDSPNGVRAACAAGSPVIAVPVYHRRDTIRQLVEAGATRIFLDWREMNIEGVIANLNAIEK